MPEIVENYIEQRTVDLQSHLWCLSSLLVRCFTPRNLPIYVAVPHFPRRNGVCMYDGPSARITFADKKHARLHLQCSIEPRHSVRRAGFYLDLNDLRHVFLLRLKCRAR
jgi:hypothetical protein